VVGLHPHLHPQRIALIRNNTLMGEFCNHDCYHTVMQQVTWRADNDLVTRVKLTAKHLDLSMNEYLTQIVRAATDPSLSSSSVEEVRARLRLAGLLVETPPPTVPPPDQAAVAAARKRAGQGTPLSELVRANR